jgi:DNA (cytosine-5)-methyltransferase 1
MLENVEEFRDWGPLIETADGKLIPCPLRKGLTFKRWVRELKKLGYAVEYRELRACDYGAPTIRKRLFLIARCDGRRSSGRCRRTSRRRRRRRFGLKPWRTAAECIDWSLPCPSIFERKKPLAEATLRRIARGIKRYVLEAPQPFIVHGAPRRDGRCRAECGWGGRQGRAVAATRWGRAAADLHRKGRFGTGRCASDQVPHELDRI